MARVHVAWLQGGEPDERLPLVRACGLGSGNGGQTVGYQLCPSCSESSRREGCAWTVILRHALTPCRSLHPQRWSLPSPDTSLSYLLPARLHLPHVYPDQRAQRTMPSPPLWRRCPCCRRVGKGPRDCPPDASAPPGLQRVRDQATKRRDHHALNCGGTSDEPTSRLSGGRAYTCLRFLGTG